MQITICRGEGSDFWIRTTIGNDVCDRCFTVDHTAGEIEVPMTLVDEVTQQQQERICKSAHE